MRSKVAAAHVTAQRLSDAMMSVFQALGYESNDLTIESKNPEHLHS
jgi:hypothetical protein